MFYAHIKILFHTPLVSMFIISVSVGADTKEKRAQTETIVRKDPRMGTNKSQAAFSFPTLSIHIRREWNGRGKKGRDI
jgi:hypothetical protein